MKWGAEQPNAHDLSSLRVLGTVGEPINPKAWLWYHLVIGRERCPIIDTWWQTETGQMMISPLPGLTECKPGSATFPLPGVVADVVDETTGESVEQGQGLLVLKRPWPGMLRTLYGDDERYVETYFSRFGNDTYLVGDAAIRDKDGYLWIVGRIDDVINVSGHRLSTAEVESAIVAHEKVAEAAVVPGAFYLWIVEHLFRDNELIAGELEVGGERVDLGRIECPLNLLAGAADHITPADQVFALADYASTPADDVMRDTTAGGHLGLFMGHEALSRHWPPLLAAVRARSG